ncbi:MAG TPA: ATP-grasp domain-containing protein [Lacunisphaera sp.]|nr:ATP-grasp domain-containing protein [Lacunisphaera sp.]
MSPTLMIIGGAKEHSFGVLAARKLGCKVLVTDGSPAAEAFAVADYHAVASTYDIDQTLAAARAHLAGGGRIDGVMTLASDVPLTVASVAHALRLPGIPVESARLASEKLAMKDAFARAGVPIPGYAAVAGPAEVRAAAARWGYPLIIKPVDSRGARGVQRLLPDSDLPAAYAEAARHSPTGRVMVEQYLAGPQLSTEGFMIDGRAHIPVVFDRNYEFLETYAPFIVEDGGEMPSVHMAAHGEEARQMMEEAALALGIRNGIIKGDLVIHEGRVKVIELAARMSGGFLATVAAGASQGVDLLSALVRFSLGRKLTPADVAPTQNLGAAIRFAFPPPGRVAGVDGLAAVQADPACAFAHVFVRPGDTIEPITCHPSRPAVVVTRGPDRAAAAAAAKRLIGSLRWQLT